MNGNRNTLGLAAVLAATVLTGGAAILGLVHRPVAAPAPAAVIQQVQPSPHVWHEGGD